MKLHAFFTTSIGIYVLIDLYMNDLYPSESSSGRDYSFVSFIIKYIKRFQPEFQELILHRLTLTYSIVHKPEFIIQQRKNEDEQMQLMNDKLFQRTLKLKEWCRLKIKDNCSQNNIKQLNLSKSLINYCSFGFFESNYASQCIGEVIKKRKKNIFYFVIFLGYQTQRERKAK
jgi:beta-glucosidase/6-phospho-beta-glucosidase/beta-galactosidase